MAARRKSSILRPLERLRARMESLQQQTEHLLDDAAASTETPRIKRLRRPAGLRRTKSEAAGPSSTSSRLLTGTAENLLNGLEQELMKRLGVLLRRLEVPSREDLDRLSDRVEALEERLRTEHPTAQRVPQSRPRRRRRIAKP